MALKSSGSAVVKALNGLLTTELRAINQYFLDSKLAAHQGLEHLAEEFRKASFEEMNDAEELMDRILLLGGLPNLQRVDPFATGETVTEQFNLALELETKAVSQLREAIVAADKAGDQGTAAMLTDMLVEEEGQVEWIQGQLGLIEKVGEQAYLAQQIRS
jgi:bacterioferritin